MLEGQAVSGCTGVRATPICWRVRLSLAVLVPEPLLYAGGSGCLWLYWCPSHSYMLEGQAVWLYWCPSHSYLLEGQAVSGCTGVRATPMCWRVRLSLAVLAPEPLLYAGGSGCLWLYWCPSHSYMLEGQAVSGCTGARATPICWRVRLSLASWCPSHSYMLEGQAVSGCTGARATPICWRGRLSLAVLVSEPLLYAGGSGCLWLYWCPSHSYMLEGQAVSGCTGARATPICWRIRLSLAVLVSEPLLYAGGSGCLWLYWCPSHSYMLEGQAVWLYWCPSHSYLLEGQADSGCTGVRATPICWRVRLSLAVLAPEPLLYAGGSGCLWLYWCPSHSYMLEGQAVSDCTGARATPICWRVRLSLAVLVSEPLLYAGGSGCLWLYWCPSHSYMLEGQAVSGCTGARATPICWRVRLSLAVLVPEPLLYAGGSGRLSLAVLVPEPLLYAGGSGCLWLYWCPSHCYMLEGQAVSGCTGVRATPICWRVRLTLAVLVSEPLLFAGGSGCLWLYWHPSHSYMLEGQAVSGCTGARATPICWRVRLSLAVLVSEPLLYAGGSGCLWLYWCPSHSYMLEGQAVSGCTGARATPICWRVRLSGCTGARATPICWRVRLSLASWCPSHSYMLEGQAVSGCTGVRATPICWRVRLSLPVLVSEPLLFAGGSGCLWLYWRPSHSYMLEGQAVSGCTGARATPICWRVRLSLAVLVSEPLLYAGGSGCLWLYWCPSHSYLLEGQAVSGCTGVRATPICWRVRLSLAVLVPEPLLYAGGSGCLWLYWCPSHSYMLEGQAVSGCTGVRATPICWRVRLSLAVLAPEPLLYAGGSGCLWLYWCPSHSYMLEGQAVSGCTGARATPICWRVRLSLAVLVSEPLLYAGGSGCLWLYWCPSHSYMLEGQAVSGCTGARATPICWRVRLSLAVLVPEPLLYAGGSGRLSLAVLVPEPLLYAGGSGCLWLYWCPSHSYMLEGQAVSGCTGARATPICWRVRLSLAVLVPEPLLYAGGSGCLWLYWCPSHSYMLEGQAVSGCTGARATPICWRVRLSLAVLVSEPLLYAGGSGCLWLYWCPSHSYMLEGQAVSGCTGVRATPICWRVRLSLAVLVSEPLLFAGGSGCLWLYWCPSHSYMLEGQAVSGCTGVRATPICYQAVSGCTGVRATPMCWRVRLSLAVLVPEPLLYAGGSGCLWLYWCPSHSYMLEGQAVSGCTGARATPICWRVRLSLAVLVPEPLLYAGGSGCLWLYWCPSHSYMLEGQAVSG